MRGLRQSRRGTSALTALFVVLALLFFYHATPVVHGDDKAPARPLPAKLAKAIRDDDLTAVSSQLDAGVDANTRDEFGNTPLLLAAV